MILSQFFTFCDSCDSSLVSLEVFPQHKSCWSCSADNCYLSLYFYFFSFSILIQCRIGCYLLLSVPTILSCSFLLSIFFILLFSTLLSIPCSVFSLVSFAHHMPTAWYLMISNFSQIKLDNFFSYIRRKCLLWGKLLIPTTLNRR